MIKTLVKSSALLLLISQAYGQQPGLESSNFVVESLPISGLFRITSGDGALTFLEKGPFVRVGRKPTVAEFRAYSANKIEYWPQIRLTEFLLLKRNVWKENDKTIVFSEYEFSRPDSAEQKILLELTLEISPKNWIDFEYRLKPAGAAGIVLELGLSFLLPKQMRYFSWRGKGPEASFMRETGSLKRGVYHFQSTQFHFSGSKSGVDLAIIVDQKGNGVGIVGENENIACDILGEGILLSHNALVSGYSTERRLTKDVIPIDELNEIKGEFRLVPLVAGRWPALFRNVFRN